MRPARRARRARESLESGRPEMRQTLDRAEKFLNLVALLAALLSAVAVGMAAREFAAATWTTAPCCACWA
jgi:putative ABC transport system permease protein